MRRLFFGIACTLMLATDYTPAFAEDSAPAPTCEQLSQSLEAVKNATTFEEVDAAMVKAGWNSATKEEFQERMGGDLKLLRDQTTMLLVFKRMELNCAD